MTDTQGKTTAATTGHPLENDTTLEKCIREHPLLRSKEATFYRPDRQLALQTGRQQARLHSELQMAFDSISIWQGDIKTATNVRDIEEVDYDALYKDYSESVDALQHPSQF